MGSRNGARIFSEFILTAFGVWMWVLSARMLAEEGWHAGVFFTLLYGGLSFGLALYMVLHPNQEDEIEGVQK